MLLKGSGLDSTGIMAGIFFADAAQFIAGIISALCAPSIDVERRSIAKAALQTIDIDMVMSMPHPLVVWLGSSYQELGSALRW